MAEILSPDAVLRIGLNMVGFETVRQDSVRRKKNLERFTTHFGSKPVVYAAIWADLQTTDIDEASVDGENASIESLLMAAHFLKCYPKMNEAEGIFKLSDNTIGRVTWRYIQKLQALKAQKIVFPTCWGPGAGGEETIFTLSVDGVHCRIFEPSHGRYSKNPAYYSHKFKQAGLDYEVAMSIYENRCVWIYGPFPAGKNDMSVFRAPGGLKERMSNMQGKFGIADLGYRGEEMLRTPNTHDSPEVRAFKSAVLARHEKFNGQLKNFACLSERFRHGIEKHQMCFDAVAVICQYQLENGSPLNVV